ncbi:MAG TPA: formyl transferase [Mesorhizobium sp.]|jgi:hypothetical protein|nr:formyl transferase [Mesorhizobium sp.]
MTDIAKPKTICVVTAGGPYPWIITNALGDRFGPIEVIVEDPEPRGAFLRRRAKKQGWLSVAGQFATMTLVKAQKTRLAQRLRAIEEAHGLRPEPDPIHRVTRVPSANGPQFIEAMKRIKPDVVLLVGCRILKAETLRAIPCPVLNYHAGITPAYRGVNGGYWALASGDAENFGTTVHLVDDGVDTGGIIAQARGRPEPGDSIATYAHRFAAMSRELCADAVAAALEGRLRPKPASGPSRQWFHPPVWRYLWNGVAKGIW